MKTRNHLSTSPLRQGDNKALSTCWTMVREAADGVPDSRDIFAWRYEPIVRAYLGARWRCSHHTEDLDDAIQEVFLECFREGGALDKVSGTEAGRFRTFLFAVTRNVARRVEERRARNRAKIGPQDPQDLDVPGADESLGALFDRSWAVSLVQQARDLLESRARESGDRAVKRARLLRMRFNEGKPIRQIAKEWEVEASYLHHEYATARNEFARALRDVVAFHQPDSLNDVDEECARIKRLLRS